MTIAVGKNNKTIRETTAPYEYNDDGELKTDEIRVLYYSQTIRELKAYRAEIEKRIAADPEAVIWVSETLAPRLHSLPDLTDEHGKPFEISVENLESVPLKNLQAIKNAIEEDTAGK